MHWEFFSTILYLTYQFIGSFGAWIAGGGSSSPGGERWGILLALLSRYLIIDAYN